MAIDIKKVLQIPNNIDKRSSEALVKSIKDNYVKDFDYIKFIHSVQNLQKLGIDEEKAFQSAYSTAETMGFSKEAFEETSRHYLSVLRQQRERFAEALKRQRAEKIDNQLDSQKAYEDKIAKNLKMIEKLKAENVALQKKLDNFDQTIQKEKEKLEDITNKFVNSYEHFENKINSDIELFNQYIN